MGFCHCAGTVGIKQIQQVIHPHLQLAPLVGLGDEHALIQLLKDDGVVLDVIIAVDGVALHTVDAEAAGRLAEGYQR